MKKNKYYFYLTFFLVLIGFIYSSVTAYKYIEKYDILKNINGNLKNIYFFEKEGGTPTFWHEASKIKREITDKPFIETGNKYEFNYLPSRIIYFYYNLIGEDIKIKDKFKTNNSKFGLIILQNFLYFVSLLSLLYVLFKKYSYQNIFSIIGIAFFLSFEPTLNQWNRILYSINFSVFKLFY